MYCSVPECLDEAAQRYADRIAYREEEREITFRALRAQVRCGGTAVAAHCVPGSAVAVLSGRHIETIAACLAVAEAGCFYAQMDPTLPAYRLTQMFDVLRPALVIADEEGRTCAEDLALACTVLPMEELWETEEAQELLADRGAKITDDSPLYLVFTSGSTGVPKGVLTSHHALLCYLDGLQKVIRLAPSDVLGGQAPLDYISAIRDIYLPLFTGACTVLLSRRSAAIPAELFAELNRYRVSVLCWSAAGLALPVKLGAFNESVPERVRTVVFSGEVLPGDVLAVWQKHLPAARFINQYGPTEATASCTWYEVKEEAGPDTVLPVGRPFAHYRVFLLGEGGTPVSAGETGEICVAGPCVTLGYYRNPELTAKSFPDNPLTEGYRERILRTGDLGYFRADGELMLIGRKDRQVKHLGHRIELDEIETFALRIHGVDECGAVYLADRALLVLLYAGEADSAEIARAFRAALPAFMVPRKLIHLEEMPHLPNGKRDRKAMQALAEEMSARRAGQKKAKH